MNGVTIGIDLGSRGLRVAWACADRPATAIDDLGPATDQPWITAERPTPRSISFVSAKRQQSPAARQKVLAEFAAARDRVRSESGAEVERAVLTVPTWMESRDRAALRDAARRAGFTDVHLINDSVAAVLADDDRSGVARTVVVYSMGFSGFELGLARTARRQVRMLGHAGGARPSGVGFDYWILNNWIAGLSEREQGSVAAWPAPHWERLRAAAEDVKHRLSAGVEVACRWPPWPLDTTAGTQPELRTPTPEEFGRFVHEQVATTLQRARELLGEADLATRDIDTVMLVGGATALPAISAMLSENFAIAPRATGPDHLALGAATYGAQLRPTTAELAYDPEFVDAFDDEASVPPLSVPLPAVTNAGPITAPQPEHSSDVLLAARQLQSYGMPDEARKLLVGFIDKAHQLLAEIDAAAAASAAQEESVAEATAPDGPAVTPEQRSRAQRAIGRARTSLSNGKLIEAVSESHQAWNMAPDDDEIFKQMIEMHIDAARAAAGPDRYDDALHWLNCARIHSRFNEKVISYLVERTHAQARHYHHQGRTVEALRLVEECLELNPSHSGARELSSEIAAEKGP